MTTHHCTCGTPIKHTWLGLFNPAMAGHVAYTQPPAAPDCAIHGLHYHKDHGRGTLEDGPDEPDCMCRGTSMMDTCSVAGCGFCRASVKP